MKYLRFCTALAFSAIICILCGINLIAVLTYSVLTLLVGEYIFPLLIHLSDEVFDLNQRWSELSGSINIPDGSGILNRFPKSVRVFVMDDDSPIMTWVGWRTLIIGRGCYNLDHTQFLCAMQESAEQRFNLRSFVFLYATIGNLPYLAMRLFCRFGYLVSWILGIPLALIFSAFTNGGFSEGLRAGQAAAKVTNSIYNAISWIFLRISNLAVYLPYWPLLIWGDYDVDCALSAKGLEMSLRNLIDLMHQTNYNSPFLRERPLILRAPHNMRIKWLDKQQDAGDYHNGSLQSVEPQVQIQHRLILDSRQQMNVVQETRRSDNVKRIRIVENEHTVEQNGQRSDETRRIRIVERNDHGEL